MQAKPLKSTKFVPSVSLLTFFSIFNRSSVSQVVTLILDSKPVSVLCQMGDFGCGDGGWTPGMKIDGNKVLPNLAGLQKSLSVFLPICCSLGRA